MNKFSLFSTTLLILFFLEPVLARDPITLAVGYGGRRMITTDGGQNWTHDTHWIEKGGDDNKLLRGACYGAGTFVAVGGSKIAPIIVSKNGIDWQEQQLAGGWLGDVAYGNGWFVAVGGGGSYLRSKDGLKWSARQRNKEVKPGYPRHYRKIAFGNGLFVAVGDKGRRTVSANGVTWSEDQTIKEKLKRQNILFAKGRFVIIGSGGYLTTSQDGLSWSTPKLSTTEDLRSILWDGKKFIVTAKSDLIISNDGLNWRKVAARGGVPSTIYYDPVAKTYFGFSWRSRKWTSPNGLNWKRHEDSGKNAITAIVSPPSTPKTKPE
ncbi:MAG: hypothetical protein QM496_07610 [Verrucomicrobiota bacterium]